MTDVLHIGEPSEEGQTLPCPRCGKPLAPFVTDCPDCAARVGVIDSSAQLRQHKYSFGLGELMLVIGSIAIVLGLVRIAPEVSLVAGIVILLALIRTLGALHRARGWKVRLSTGDVIWLIVTSLGISLLIVVSSAIAFFATCFPTGMIGSTIGPLGILAGIGVGIVAAIFVARRLHKALWMAGSPPKLLGIQYLEDPPEAHPTTASQPERPA